MKLIKLILLAFLILMLISCETCPEERLSAKTGLILKPVENSPNLIPFSPDNPELKDILVMQLEYETYILKLLFELEASGSYDPDDLNEEVSYVEKKIDWIMSVVE